jgi:peptidoglycan/LPS O-acetylase OafA/YrhL
MQIKILPLEGLRGIAAVSVALFHFRINSHISGSYISNSHVFVQMFFILSGFIMSMAYLDKINDLSTLLKFQTRRLLRLYPLHFITLFAWLGIETLKLIVEIKFDLIANTPAFSVNDFLSFILNIFLLQDWVQSQLTWNQPSWSISAEFYTYLMFGTVLLISRKHSSISLIISLLILVVSIIILFFCKHIPALSAFTCVYSFFLGTVFHKIFTILPYKNVSIVYTIGSWVSLVFSVYVIVTFQTFSNFFQVLVPAVLFGTTILMVSAANQTGYLALVLGNKYLVFLGTVSYGIYMIHSIVWWFFNQFFRFILNFNITLNESGNSVLVVPNKFIGDLILFTGIILIILLSYLSFRFLESRFIKTSHHNRNL